MIAESVAEALYTCSIDEVRESWDRVAPTWSAFVREDDVHRKYIHGPALLELCGDVRGLQVLDIGCGEGWCSRELARSEADVTALDVSPGLIEEARRHPEQEAR